MLTSTDGRVSCLEVNITETENALGMSKSNSIVNLSAMPC